MLSYTLELVTPAQGSQKEVNPWSFLTSYLSLLVNSRLVGEWVSKQGGQLLRNDT